VAGAADSCLRAFVVLGSDGALSFSIVAAGRRRVLRAFAVVVLSAGFPWFGLPPKEEAMTARSFIPLVLLGVLLLPVESGAQCQPDPAQSFFRVEGFARLRVFCPRGDVRSNADVGHALVVSLKNADGAPCEDVEIEEFELDGLFSSDTFADAFFPFTGAHDLVPGFLAQPAAGVYRLEGPIWAGGTDEGPLMKVRGIRLALRDSDRPFYLTSFDLSGNGKVDLVDLGEFAHLYASDQYHWQIDFFPDGRNDLADIGEYALHNGHLYPVGAIVDPVD
jgi:hypothetical protein